MPLLFFKKELLSFIICFTVLSLSAQNKDNTIFIKGCVNDVSTNEPLYGATIRLKERCTIGTTSDLKGFFKLQLPADSSYTLEISFIGYENQYYKVNKEEKDTVRILLKESVHSLNTIVITGTRTPKLLKETPIVTKLISEEEIKSLDLPNVQDLLQTELPGIEFTYSMNQQVSLNMQGFGGNSVLFLVDGERLAGETLDNVDYSRLNLDNVSRIEIVKGAASSLYGSNAVGGVINIISKDNTEAWTCNINANYGTHNKKKLGGSVGFRWGNFKNITHLQYTSCDAIKLKNEGDFGTIYANHTIHFKDKLTYTLLKKHTLTARAGYYFRERESQSTSNERYRDFNGGLKGNFLINKSNNLDISYAFDQYDKSDYLFANNSDVRDYSNVQNSLRSLYNHSFNNKHTLTIGGDYLYDYLMSYQFENKGSYSQHTADGFAQFDWNPTKKLNIISAVRYDYYSDAQVQHFSPKLGVMYKWKDFSLRASYADGFRAPTLKEMYMQFNMANIFMIYGNKDLKAETSHNFNTTAEYTKNGYNIILMGFYNMVNQRITTAWNRELNGMRYINMSPLQIMGLDFNASAAWKCGLSARLAYVFTYENIKKGEAQISSTRPHTATANICYGKKWEKYSFKLVLTGRFLSEVTCDEYTSLTDFEKTEKVTYPGYMIWKMAFNQCLYKGCNLYLSLDNLFNYVPDYYYNNSPATTGRTYSIGISLDINQFFRHNKS